MQQNDPMKAAARLRLPTICRELGIDLPGAVAAALEHRNGKPLDLPPAPSTATLVAAIRAATDHGTDPAADPEVQRLLAARQLAPLAVDRAVEQLDTAAVDDCIAAHAAAIVAALGAVVDRDGATLTDARRQLGNIDIDQPGIANTLTDTHAAMWVRARDARTRIEQARKLWRLLVHVGRLGAVNPHRRICEIAAPSLDEYRSLPNDADAWAAVRAGLTISAAVPATEYEHRSQALDDEQAAEHAEQQQAASRGLRFTR